jgi:hypothetical protein
VSRCAIIAVGALLVACHQASVGACSADDMRHAHTVVYDTNGSPAYAGQALLIGSCAGGGAFCHASSAMRRYGAPWDLNFDPVLADDARFGGDFAAGEQHLYAAQRSIREHRDDIYGTVWNGTMPPGQIGSATMTAPYVTYASATSSHGAPIFDLSTDEGIETLRAWLACGSPVIEATTGRAPMHCAADSDCAPLAACDATSSTCTSIGDVAPRHELMTSPTWSSLYANVIAPSCAQATCHTPAFAQLGGHLDLSSASIAYAQLVNQPPTATGCGTRVVPGHPEQSFLMQKLMGAQSTTTCGTTMPVGAMLPANEIALVGQWITAGAMND